MRVEDSPALALVAREDLLRRLRGSRPRHETGPEKAAPREKAEELSIQNVESILRA